MPTQTILPNGATEWRRGWLLPLLALGGLALTMVGTTPTSTLANGPVPAVTGSDENAPPAANEAIPKGKSAPPPAELSQAEGLATKINEMASDLYNHLGGDDSDPKVGLLSDGIVVCSFVELKKVTQTSSFGRYLAEQTMSEFQRRGFTVFELRKRAAVKIQEKKGEFGLSRQAGEINTTVVARTMITGTYTAAGDQILVNARVIDNKTGALLAAATTVFPRTLATNQLLAETATLSSPKAAKNDAVLYMKKLEL